MVCETVTMPGGGRAIVCSSHKRQRCKCGRDAFLLCDWKVPGKTSGTCDAPICHACAFSPATGKDLCREHKAAFFAWHSSRNSEAARG
ncbi:hypothetical protein GCM10011380_08540 [Sphingomonas metalli]|uniref:Uncharacterized protein n=1 Tax=Sphingomonas metalli TaxID=1779358 RepID=A0A916WP66_9SPHN|nr:hypothetical protein [Sphingomonas metalli]GGB21205.1 hypothetical protein GCM10011380_08540 [Sphingomonas metalli]